ncbi:class I SAM-dependent methyltransferase [Geodermatophilus sp. CPCC 206100]|uniref:class I SAM-dependent methyltransferase n=1 Tax=Geodermatophilus sp. CPCC 206100 TaxID=3020054 RepID=UPI003B0069E7
MAGPEASPGPWSGAAAYEAYVGRWSRAVAPRFLDWLGVPTGLSWLDVGCGTGVLTEAVLATASPAAVVAVDPSPAFLAAAAQRVVDDRVTFREGTAQALPVAEGSVDVVVSGLVLNFVPDRPAALAEMRRAARPGGVVAAYVWDYAEGMQVMRHLWDAAVARDPAVAALDEGRRFVDGRPDRLRDLFTGAGLADVAVGEVVVPTVFRGFDDYWGPFLGGTGPAPAYVVSLAEADRTELREALRARLPADDDGTIRLTARAWTVQGRSG